MAIRNDRYPEGLIRAIDNWQSGSKDKARKARRLREWSRDLPASYRPVPQTVYRQVRITAVLGIGVALSAISQTVSSWTTSLEVAQQFREEDQNCKKVMMIFARRPAPGDVIIDLNTVYADNDFLETVQATVARLKKPFRGIERWKNTQNEVVLNETIIGNDEIVSLGAFRQLSDVVPLIGARDPNAPSDDEIYQEFTGKRPDEHFWTSPESADTGVRNAAGTPRGQQNTPDRSRRMSSLPIADYGLVSDCHSAALVSRMGSIDWLCLPRFSAPSIFGRLLDDKAGHWSIHPTVECTTTRRYIDQTLVLETTFRTSTGKAVLLDCMAVGKNERGHQLGAEAPHALLRSLRCTDGEMEFESEYVPRPEYGLVYPLLSEIEGGVRARGGATDLRLSSPVPVVLDESTCRARFHLKAGQTAPFALQYRSSWEPSREHWAESVIDSRIDDTINAWRSWSSLHQNYQGPWQELVLQSGRILQGLTYYPTGAIVAAATTSLPETPGGSRNWDYRFCWVRDGSLTLEALWVAACPDEANKFFDFLTGAALTQIRRGVDLQIMFGIGGEHDLTERELPHLSGWRCSRPVRIGNGAWNQRQVDVYGELLGSVYLLREQLQALDGTTKDFLADVADAAAARWKEKDQGIWEMRGEPRHFLYSKLMCWVALDRAIQLAGQIGAQDRVSRWASIRDEIKSAILEQGWNDRVHAFTQSFGSDDLDASNLAIPIVGFLPPNDPRVISTIEATAKGLTDEHGLLYRYRAHDGLEGEEGTFLLCTFWFAQAQAMAGRVEQAKETFSRAVGFANDLGLLAEEADPKTRELLGNFPQAFSHIGLVNAAWAISEAERRVRELNVAERPSLPKSA